MRKLFLAILSLTGASKRHSEIHKKNVRKFYFIHYMLCFYLYIMFLKNDLQYMLDPMFYEDDGGDISYEKRSDTIGLPFGKIYYYLNNLLFNIKFTKWPEKSW